MSTPVNLNKARKIRQRASKKARAVENSARFGQTKAERQAARDRDEKAVRFVDSHKRET